MSTPGSAPPWCGELPDPARNPAPVSSEASLPEPGPGPDKIEQVGAEHGLGLTTSALVEAPRIVGESQGVAQTTAVSAGQEQARRLVQMSQTGHEVPDILAHVEHPAEAHGLSLRSAPELRLGILEVAEGAAEDPWGAPALGPGRTLYPEPSSCEAPGSPPRHRRGDELGEGGFGAHSLTPTRWGAVGLAFSALTSLPRHLYLTAASHTATG